MQRQRLNQMRQTERGNEGLQQVINGSPTAPSLSGRRKTTYTRTELLTRGEPTTGVPSRRARNKNESNTTDWGMSSPVAQRGANQFLPRVARLAVPKPDKSNFKALSKSPYLPSGSENSCSSEQNKIKLAKAIRLPDQHNKSFVYLCKPVKQVKELLTARQFHPSCEEDAPTEESSQLQSLITSSSSCSNLQNLDIFRQRQQELESVMQPPPEQSNSSEINVKVVQVKKQQKRELEKLVCQNLPNLQHEIKLLQQLGEKLEATLRVSTNQSPESRTAGGGLTLSQEIGPSSSAYFTPRSSLALYHHPPEELPITQFGCLLIEFRAVPSQRAVRLASRHIFGLIQEFRLELKTLNDIKTADDNQCFYLPFIEGKDSQLLKRTSFRFLRENPQELLQQLRPLTPLRPFNLLEQDTMFFNSLVYGESLHRETGGGVRSAATATTQTEQEEEPVTTPVPIKKRPVAGKSKKKPKVLPPATPARRRMAPPLPPQHLEVDPKIHLHLLKTILVGLVQIGVFLILIMAFTYPDVSC